MATESTYAATMRTSRLASLVMWNDNKDKFLMGLLLGYVEGMTFQSHLDTERHEGCKIAPEFKPGWTAQIESTLFACHRCRLG
ncbi:hypothetical protein F4823DRAFT_601389 [Ustulina deusta]|nr:hypothetical protein F4823DRAFT_601389 [Ustulina deusta]